MEDEIYTTKTAAPLLGVKQDTLKRYALESGIGAQPAGPGTLYLFTKDDLLAIREWKRSNGRFRTTASQLNEDREALGVGPFYGPKGEPNL